jgi:hypothetical protein
MNRVFESRELVARVFRFLEGDGVFLALVSTNFHCVVVGAGRKFSTTFESALESVTRLEVAYSSCGLDVAKQVAIRLAAGRHASKRVLLRARELGMPLDESVSYGAAEADRALMLRWLHLRLGCPLGLGIRQIAIVSGSIKVLVWLRKSKLPVGGRWSQTWLTEMLFTAGVRGQIGTSIWLLSEGARWPRGLIYAAALSGDQNVKFISWARQAGCPWDWRAIYCDKLRQKGLEHVLSCIHEEGLPCSCQGR